MMSHPRKYTNPEHAHGLLVGLKTDAHRVLKSHDVVAWLANNGVLVCDKELHAAAIKCLKDEGSAKKIPILIHHEIDSAKIIACDLEAIARRQRQQTIGQA